MQPTRVLMCLHVSALLMAALGVTAVEAAGAGAESYTGPDSYAVSSGGSQKEKYYSQWAMTAADFGSASSPMPTHEVVTGSQTGHSRPHATSPNSVAYRGSSDSPSPPSSAPHEGHGEGASQNIISDGEYRAILASLKAVEAYSATRVPKGYSSAGAGLYRTSSGGHGSSIRLSAGYRVGGQGDSHSSSAYTGQGAYSSPASGTIYGSQTGAGQSHSHTHVEYGSPEVSGYSSDGAEYGSHDGSAYGGGHGAGGGQGGAGGFATFKPSQMDISQQAAVVSTTPGHNAHTTTYYAAAPTGGHDSGASGYNGGGGSFYGSGSPYAFSSGGPSYSNGNPYSGVIYTGGAGGAYSGGSPYSNAGLVYSGGSVYSHGGGGYVAGSGAYKGGAAGGGLVGGNVYPGGVGHGGVYSGGGGLVHYLLPQSSPVYSSGALGHYPLPAAGTQVTQVRVVKVAVPAAAAAAAQAHPSPQAHVGLQQHVAVGLLPSPAHALATYKVAPQVVVAKPAPTRLTLKQVALASAPRPAVRHVLRPVGHVAHVGGR